MLRLFQSYLGAESTHKVGAQHILNAEYFKRIDALNYTMMHDDGQLADDLENADVVLVGVSRTSKTPTSIYLANRGVKTANIPLVPGMPPPAALEAVRRPLVVGLFASAERIVQIRQNRLLGLNAHRDDDQYIDRQAVAEEIAFSRRLCAKHDWPLIDVTRRSIEETAAAIMALLAERRRLPAAMTDVVVARRPSRWCSPRAAHRAGPCSRRPAFPSRSACPISTSARSRRRRARAVPPRRPCCWPAKRRAAVARTSRAGWWSAPTRRWRWETGDSTSPVDRAAARAQLVALSGSTHELHSAVAVARRGGVVRCQSIPRSLTMRACRSEFLDAYLDAAGEAVLESVGGYQLERLGIHLFERIEGDHFTILGLPLFALIAFLRREGSLAG